MRSRFGISSALLIGSGKRSRGGSHRRRESRPPSCGNSGSRRWRGALASRGAAIRDSHSSALAPEHVRTLPESRSDTSDDSWHTRGRTFAHEMGCSTWARLRDSQCKRPEAACAARLDRRVPSRSRRDSRHSPQAPRPIDALASRVSDHCGTRCRRSGSARARNQPASNPGIDGDSGRTRAGRSGCGRS